MIKKFFYSQLSNELHLTKNCINVTPSFRKYFKNENKGTFYACWSKVAKAAKDFHINSNLTVYLKRKTLYLNKNRRSSLPPMP